MAKPELELFNNCWEFIPKEKLVDVPHKTRGIYVLYQEIPGVGGHKSKYVVVYIGMAGGTKAGIHGRLKAHANSKRKADLWSHFSFYQVSNKIAEGQLRDIEGTIQHIYRKDPRVNILNLQKGFAKLRKIRTRHGY